MFYLQMYYYLHVCIIYDGSFNVECLCGLTDEFADEKPARSLAVKKLTRNKRNAVAYYKRLPEFWAWYKYYMDTHNQEGVSSLIQFIDQLIY